MNSHEQHNTRTICASFHNKQFINVQSLETLKSVCQFVTKMLVNAPYRKTWQRLPLGRAPASQCGGLMKNRRKHTYITKSNFLHKDLKGSTVRTCRLCCCFFFPFDDPLSQQEQKKLWCHKVKYNILGPTSLCARDSMFFSCQFQYLFKNKQLMVIQQQQQPTTRVHWLIDWLVDWCGWCSVSWSAAEDWSRTNELGRREELEVWGMLYVVAWS